MAGNKVFLFLSN